MGRLEGKTAIVTGAASGIGEGIACIFAREGARLALVDIQQDRGSALARKLGRDSQAVFFHRADLSDGAEAERVINAVAERFGVIDILVNNAGFYGLANKKSVAETPEDVWDRTMNVNVRTVYLLCKYALPHMVRRRSGSIINIASIGGLEAFPEFAAYCVSKGALIQLTRSLAIDFGPHNIRANAICPGAIDTPGNEVFIRERGEYLALIASTTPLRDIGQPEDIGYAALYLASDEARYVTGTTLVVDGGRTSTA